MFGGLRSSPWRFGGGQTQLEILLISLNNAMGTAYTTDQTSVVYLRNLAMAKVIRQMLSSNQRLANQGDPNKLSTLLSRWEKIMALPINPDLSDTERRLRVSKLIARFGAVETYQYVTDTLTRELGPVFVSLEFIDVSLALIGVPDGSYPYGSVFPGNPWFSTVDHILIRLQKPAGYNEAQFYEAAGKVGLILDPILPVWNTFDWYRAPEPGPPIDMSPEGPTAAGFYLDQEHNLDNNILDV